MATIMSFIATTRSSGSMLLHGNVGVLKLGIEDGTSLGGIESETLPIIDRTVGLALPKVLSYIQGDTVGELAAIALGLVPSTLNPKGLPEPGDEVETEVGTSKFVREDVVLGYKVGFAEMFGTNVVTGTGEIEGPNEIVSDEASTSLHVGGADAAMSVSVGTDV